MPPKRKKADPEELKAQFETWKQGDEYKQYEKIGSIIRDKGIRLTTTSTDLPGDWETFLETIYELFKMIKVKTGKVKKIDQPQVRSLFFARQDTEKEEYFIDGIHCGVSKELADTAYFCRHRICELIDLCNDSLGDLTFDLFSAFRKDMQKRGQEFIKFFTIHSRNGHKVIYEQNMASVFKPLKELVDINYTYLSFMNGFIPDSEREIRDFKLRAIEAKYVMYWQEVMRVLYDETKIPYKDSEKPEEVIQRPLTCCPDVKKLFYKINLKNWKENPIEKLYLQPLHITFKRVQKTIWGMWYKGINYWEIPLSRNTQMIDHMQAVINAEMIAERLLGTPLRRDQLNFLYKVVKIIDESDSLIRDNMRKKDNHTLTKSIPKLVVYKQIQWMRKYKDQKLEDEQKAAILKEKMTELKQLRKEEDEKSLLKQANRSFAQSFKPEEESKDQKKPSSPQKKNPLKGKRLQQISEEEDESEEQKKKREEEEKYGRYWILEQLISDDMYKVAEDCVELIRHINLAVQQDIDDKIIMEGMKPDAERGSKQSKEAALHQNDKNEKDNQDTKTIMSRPPYLWNFPKILDKHDFRSIADPKQSYIDGRIEQFEVKIDMLAQHIQKHYKYYWQYLLDRVIDGFEGGVGKYNPDIKNLPFAEFHIQSVKIKWEELEPKVEKKEKKPEKKK